jgi:copper(I)-binding protein
MKSMIIAACLAAALLTPALAQEKSQSVTVTSVWARATPPGAKTGAIYMTLVNKGGSADKLVEVSTPVADKAQLHIDSNDNGVMKMRPLKEVDLKPGEQVVFKPGAMHVMLMGLKQPLKVGESFPLTLQFAHAGKVETPVTVAKAGAMGMSGMSDMHGMGGMNGQGSGQGMGSMGGMSHGSTEKP